MSAGKEGCRAVAAVEIVEATEAGEAKQHSIGTIPKGTSAKMWVKDCSLSLQSSADHRTVRLLERAKAGTVLAYHLDDLFMHLGMRVHCLEERYFSFYRNSIG